MNKLHYVEANNPPLICSRCSKATSALYSDAGGLGIAHGGGECYDCYMTHGHPKCPGCEELTHAWWKYCAHCGQALFPSKPEQWVQQAKNIGQEEYRKLLTQEWPEHEM